MAREPRELIPQSFFRFPSFFPSWEEMNDRMNQLIGTERNTNVTISEDDQNVYVEAPLPGLKAGDIDISINKNSLWIKGEKKEEQEDKDRKFYRRAQSSFFYQMDLPSQIEESTEKAQFEDGVLKLSFKKTQQNQMRKITISDKKQLK